MKRSSLKFKKPVHPILLIVAIGFGYAAKADDGLPDPGFEEAGAPMVNFRMIASDVADTATVTAAILVAAE